MAKKLIALTARDIILQADAETIREALESRVKIDDLLVKREEAFRQIEAIELQVEELVGEEGAFVYPAPPMPIAGFSKPVPASRPIPPKPKPVIEEEPKEEITEEGVIEEVVETETVQEDAVEAEDTTEKESTDEEK